MSEGGREGGKGRGRDGGKKGGREEGGWREGNSMAQTVVCTVLEQSDYFPSAYIHVHCVYMCT